MLDVFRRASKGWTAKILMGLLVLSFGIWGIADVFRGFSTDALATVGGRKISVEEGERLYQQRLRYYSEQSGRAITPEDARKVVETAVYEVLAVAKASNIQPPGLEDPKAALAGAFKIASQMSDALSSTGQDMQRGKRTEIDALNGYKATLDAKQTAWEDALRAQKPSKWITLDVRRAESKQGNPATAKDVSE